MEDTATPKPLSKTEILVVCKNSAGTEIRASALRLTRYQVVFELYTPTLSLQRSEVLSACQIILNDRLVYSGRAVVTNLLEAGLMVVAEAALEEGWLDLDWLALATPGEKLRASFTEFFQSAQQLYHVRPELKLVVADLQVFLLDLQRWLEQVELGIRSQPAGDRLEAERRVIAELREPVESVLKHHFERFEEVTHGIDGEYRPAHGAYVKRQLHPLVLCAPFMYRTFQKPLGYAGDYEMINMMTRDPCEGGSVFAKLLNTFFLNTPPVVAHRNRIACLTRLLLEETCRTLRRDRPARIFNLGCGPAKEIQDFLAGSELADQAQFTLLDFNEETVMHAESVLSECKRLHQRQTRIQILKRSVTQLLREAAKPASSLTGPNYDLVYCAGLFDYLPDQVCRRLIDLFYDMLAPGGLVVATNVDSSNPSRGWMEYAVDWHLSYRNSRQMGAFCPRRASPEFCAVKAEPSGVNIFLEVRKPSHD